MEFLSCCFFILSPFVAAVLIKLIINIVWSQNKKQLPSPPTLPIIGNLHQLRSHLHRSLRDLSQEYDPLMRVRLGSVPVLVVSSAEVATEVLKEHSMAFSNRPPAEFHKHFLGESTTLSFLPYGEEWRQVRNACHSGFLNLANVRSLKLEREHEVATIVGDISQACSLHHTVDLSKMLLGSSYNLLSRCTTGRDSKRADVKRFGDLFMELITKVIPNTFLVGDYFPWLRWVDAIGSHSRKVKRYSRDIDNYLDQLINEHLAKSAEEDDSDYRKSFVDHLLHRRKDNHFTRDNIKQMILEMFLAIDMVSTIIEWTMSELVKNQNEMNKAKEEVRRVVGTKSKVDEEDIQHMNYLRCIIKETLRLHPPSPLFSRQSSVATNMSGYHLPAKTSIMMNVSAIQRDIKVWDRPDEFIPDKFSNSHIDFKGMHHELIPFGSGRRACPGMLFGMTFVELVIANLLYWFDWELPENAKTIDMDESMAISLIRKTPLLLVPLPHSS